MKGHRLKAILELADSVQIKYNFVRVIGMAQGSERFYLTSPTVLISGYLKLKQDLGEDNFPFTSYSPMVLEEVLALNQKNKLPLLTENLLGRVLLASVRREDSVQLIGYKGEKRWK